MYCEKCGTKNAKDAKFCASCGHSLTNISKESKQPPKVNELKNRLSSLSKKNKIIISGVLAITIISLIALTVLLNNPVKRVEDSLEKYFRTENNSKELIYIGKILKDHKNETKVLNSIKKTVQNITHNWIKNFNKEYKDSDEVKKAYENIKVKVDDIYDYFNGLPYMLDKDIYNDYITELKSFYYSKLAYFEGSKNENEKNDYYAYYYYQKVIKDDCYYKYVKKYIDEYLKEELKTLTEEANKIIVTTDNNEDILKSYLDQLKYLNNHKNKNNIDLSETEEYQKLINESLAKIIELSQKITKDYKENSKYEEALKIINNTIKEIEKIVEEKDYQELLDLKQDLENKLPQSLLELERKSYFGITNSNYPKNINGKEYQHHLSISLNEEKALVVYNLNQKFTNLKSNLIINEDIENYEGKLIIYGDDKELTQIVINNKTKNDIELDLDLKNINDLKIELKSNKETLNNKNIYLVEPYLYK